MDVMTVENLNVEPSREEPLTTSVDEYSLELVSFLEFRRSAIHQYTSLNWLGPGVMAVYWFKEYLKKTPFDWVRIPKEDQQLPLSLSSSSLYREKRSDQDERRKGGKLGTVTNSKGNFYFIPGQYLQIEGTEYKKSSTLKETAIQNVLNFGTPDIHYATSFIGVYNLLRRYGSYAVHKDKDCNDRQKQKSRRLRMSKGNSRVILFDYNGPHLPR